MRKLKITGIGIALLILWQLVGLQLVGKRSLMKHIGNYMESPIVDGSQIPNRFYYTQLPFPEEHKAALQARYQYISDNIQFYAGRDTSLWKTSPGTYTYYTRQHIYFWGQAKVYESEHVYSSPDDAFFCDWQSKYIWVLFTWVHLEKEMKSIT